MLDGLDEHSKTPVDFEDKHRLFIVGDGELFCIGAKSTFYC